MATVVHGTATGNRVFITFDTKKVGLIQSVSAQENVGLQPVSGLGSPIPVEFVPTQTSISLTVDTIVFNKGFGTALPSALKDDVSPLGAEDLGLVPTHFDPLAGGEETSVLSGKVFDILVQHVQGGQVTTLRRYKQCSYGGGSISFQKHQMIVQNAQFMAIDYSEGDTK